MLQRDTPRLILASQSPFRRALLEGVGLRFTAHPAHVDEAAVKRAVQAEHESAEDAALLLAEMKAARVAQREPEALVIGADQILVCEDAWFAKPTDIADARAQLRALRGKTHMLATAVVCHVGEARIWHYVARPRLTMRAFSDAFLEAYLAEEDETVTTTVGGYRLEGPGMQLFDRIDGEHSAIIGLPMLSLLGFLRQHGVLLD
jgi:septum formation protein